MSPAWQGDFSKEQHTALVDRLGNLTLLTEPMNKDVSNGGFLSKRAKYVGSKYAMTRKIAEDYEKWTPHEIEVRAEELIEWAIGRWPEE